ncbi:phage holin family protein [Cronobacter malonaticus]
MMLTMVSSVAADVNAAVCTVIVVAFLLYRRNGAAHKPRIAWATYWVMLCYCIVPLAWIFNLYEWSSWFVVALNVAFCAIVLYRRGNMSKILSLLRYPNENER